MIEKCVDLDEKVKIFTENINTALDEIAPFKTFKIRSSYKFGLSDKTKELMKLRDLVRNKISSCKGNEKVVLNQKYKALRNQVNNLL